MFKKFATLLVLIIALAVPLVGCGGEQAEKIEPLTIEGEIEETANYFGNPEFSGVVKNNTDEEINYVEITFILYDKDDNKVGESIDTTTDLKADGTWKFKATTIATESVDYDHYEVTFENSF